MKHHRFVRLLAALLCLCLLQLPVGAAEPPLTRGEMAQLLVDTLELSMDPGPFENDLTDVTPDTPHYEAILICYQKDIMLAYQMQDGSVVFEPGNPMSKADAAVFLHRACGLPTPRDPLPNLPDVPADRWYTDSVYFCVQIGAITCHPSGAFGPNNKVLRSDLHMEKLKEELAKIKIVKPYETASYSLIFTQQQDGTLILTGYEGTPAGELVLPAVVDGLPVTAIGKGALQFCRKLTGNLVIPEHVEEIGKFAFRNCSGMNGTLTLPEGLRAVGEEAFADCYKLTGSLTIPDSVTAIGDRAFAGCDRFSGVLSIGAGLSVLGKGALCEYPGTEIRVSDQNQRFRVLDQVLLTMDGKTVLACPTGKEGPLVLPDTVEEIGPRAFSLCEQLTGPLTLPAGLHTIGDSAFFSCRNLTGTLTIPAGVRTIGTQAFTYCRGLSGTVTIPASVQEIGDRAFSAMGCREFSVSAENQRYQGQNGMILSRDGTTLLVCPGQRQGRLQIPDGVKIIAQSAFERCGGLTGKLVLPAGLTKIEQNAFSYCEGLTGDVIIPETVTNIHNSVFEGCKNLTAFRFMGHAPRIMGAWDEWTGSFPADVPLYYLEGKTGWTDSEDYDAAAGTWNNYALRLWQADEQAPVTLEDVAYRAETREILVPPMAETVQVMLGAYYQGRLQAFFLSQGSPADNRWTVPENIQFDTLKVFAMDEEKLPVCSAKSMLP